MKLEKPIWGRKSAKVEIEALFKFSKGLKKKGLEINKSIEVPCPNCFGKCREKDFYGYHNDYTWENCLSCAGEGKWLKTEYLNIYNEDKQRYQEQLKIYKERKETLERIKKKLTKTEILFLKTFDLD